MPPHIQHKEQPVGNLHKHVTPMTVIESSVVQDPRLTAEALGILIYATSFPDGVQTKQVAEHFSLSIESVETTLLQLLSLELLQEEN
jgi:hypothetical protein